MGGLLPAVQETLELIVQPRQRASSVSAAVAVSVVLHSLIVFFFLQAYRAPETIDAAVPMARYVELIRSNPREFVEAPGREVASAPLDAPYSDRNRRASTPTPTGDTPTSRPGDGRGAYTPPIASGDGRPASPAIAPQPAVDQRAAAPADSAEPADAGRRAPEPASTRIQPLQAGASVDWRSAIRQVGQTLSPGGRGEGAEAGTPGGGGEKGFAEAGPLSFETQWYEWGDYAQSMVSKIRVNWYSNMPQIIRTGLKGVVTIRFTIQRDGSITNLSILSGSSIPPYDFAAKKAIELSSPLAPLPSDFPNADERVTVMFYYNMEVPQR